MQQKYQIGKLDGIVDGGCRICFLGQTSMQEIIDNHRICFCFGLAE